MSKKRFYKNVERNQKWTEEETGHPIDFADKYLSDEGIYSDKFDYMRPKIKKKRRNKAKLEKLSKRLGIAVACFLIISVGYTGMDIYMQRHAMPAKLSEVNNAYDGAINEVALDLKSKHTQSVSLDGSVMLDAVISELTEGGYNSVTFDLKRSEGSVGYKSALANVDTYGAIAFPATDLKTSVEKLSAQDILAVGRVFCYLDNLVPDKDNSSAVLNSNGVPYRDSRDNTYLNPDSETAYKYIKDIISEAMDMGITVFVLDGVNLPDDIADNYNDGFEHLSQRLYKDLGTGIKLLEAVNVSLSEEAVQNNEDDNNEDTENEITRKMESSLDNNKVYFITTNADKAEIKENLEGSGIPSYILAE